MRALAAALITPVAMLGWLQNHLLYFPTSRLLGNPESIGLAYESVYLQTADAVRIHGWFIPADSSQAGRASSGNGIQDGVARDGAARDGATRDGVARDGAAQDSMTRDGVAQDITSQDGTARNNTARDSNSENTTSAATSTSTVLFFHGNAGNISDRLDTISIFHRLGLNTFLIDYRGFGNSEGSPDEAGTYADAEAAWRYLVLDRGIDKDSLVFFGRSLGGGVAAFLASRHRPRAMVLESTFTSCPDLASDLYPLIPRSLISIGYDNLSRVAQLGRGPESSGGNDEAGGSGVKQEDDPGGQRREHQERRKHQEHQLHKEHGVPLLIVHSRDDELIPIAHGRRLFEAAPEPKHFLEISGTHGDGFYTSGEQYIEGLRDFFQRYL